MSQAIVANGTLLQIGDGASPEHFTTVPEMMKLSGPSVKTNLLDSTSHDSLGYFREYVPGLSDGDNIAGDMNWRPSNAIHQGVREDSYARTLRNFEVVFPDTSENTVGCATYITDLVPKADIGTLLQASLTLKVTGEPLWS